MSYIFDNVLDLFIICGKWGDNNVICKEEEGIEILKILGLIE